MNIWSKEYLVGELIRKTIKEKARERERIKYILLLNFNQNRVVYRG